MAGATSFGRSSDLRVFVLGNGVTKPRLRNAIWAEFGARLGYNVTANVSVDIFANGILGDRYIGSQVHAGAGVRVRF